MRGITRAVFIGVLLAGTTVSVSSAQNALGDGRALDANLSTQGKLNNPVKDIAGQIRFNQRVVEGQAGAGRSFQGSLGYRATDDFSGKLGSDSLYNFRRDSSSGGLATLPGLRTSDALRYQLGLTGGGGASSAGLPSSAGELFLTRRGDVSTGSFVVGNESTTNTTRQTGLMSSMRSTAQFQAVSAMMPTVLGYRGNDQGGMIAITASPLRGVGGIVARPNEAEAGKPAGYSGSGLTGLERRAGGIESGNTNPAAVVNEPLSSRLAPDGTPYKDVVEALNRAIDQRFDAPKPGDLKPGEAKPGDTKPDGTKPDKDKDKAGKTDDRPAWMKELDALSGRLKNAPKPPVAAEPKAKEGEPAEPKPIPGAKPDEEKKKILEGLKRMKLRIETFKPTETVLQSYQRSVNEGEAQLGAGEYFSAEGSFSMALVAKPRDVMASVGRMHAQIGAGLLVSAAGNLRGLLADHPEVVSTVYAPGLLPRANRCTEVVAKIRKELGNPASGLGGDGALLVAYLGRQTGNAEWLREGLADLDTRTEKDDSAGRALVEFLREVWGSAPSPATPEK